MFVEEVAAAIREVGAAEVMPRFRSLADGEVMEKSPGDLVTIADQECERVLSGRLREIRDVPVVGEEATAEDPTLLDHVATAHAAWIIDPIDGTSNFVDGDPNFVIIVAYVENGATTAGWIWHPETDTMLTAELGKGVNRNGKPLPVAERSAVPQGILKYWLMGEPARTHLRKLDETIVKVVPAIKSAGVEYATLVDGDIDFLFYWRTLPWDHAAGGLIAAEAGLRVARPDGSVYEPGDGRSGLLAATPAAWDAVAAQVQAALGGG